jgi:DNA-directed RNA polymerase subunit N (RpoN/RPB10)
MIIPVRCYTCGKVLANKYVYFQNELDKKKIELKKNSVDDVDPLFININEPVIKKTIAGEIMDDLGIIRICCRKVMLTSINIVDTI